MLLADFQSYVDCQATVSAVYQDPAQWSRMSITQCRALGQVFLRSHDLRVCSGHLARASRVPIRLLSQSDLTSGLAE